MLVTTRPRDRQVTRDSRMFWQVRQDARRQSKFLGWWGVQLESWIIRCDACIIFAWCIPFVASTDGCNVFKIIVWFMILSQPEIQCTTFPVISMRMIITMLLLLLTRRWATHKMTWSGIFVLNLIIALMLDRWGSRMLMWFTDSLFRSLLLMIGIVRLVQILPQLVQERHSFFLSAWISYSRLIIW